MTQNYTIFVFFLFTLPTTMTFASLSLSSSSYSSPSFSLVIKEEILPYWNREGVSNDHPSGSNFVNDTFIVCARPNGAFSITGLDKIVNRPSIIVILPHTRRAMGRDLTNRHIDSTTRRIAIQLSP